MSDKRHPNVVSSDEVTVFPMSKGKHQMKLRRLGAAAGAHLLGGTLTEVAPGAVSFPRHYHCATEEAIFVVRGKGTARIGDARVPVREGDWISLPVGPDHAHQMINDGADPLVYLCVSAAAQKVDVVGYPDSKKVGAMAWSGDKQLHRIVVHEGTGVDYWADEPDAT